MFDVNQPAGSYLNLVVTHECDRNCSFCVDKYVHSPERMTMATVERALVFAADHRVHDVMISRSWERTKLTHLSAHLR